MKASTSPSPQAARRRTQVTSLLFVLAVLLLAGMLWIGYSDRQAQAAQSLGNQANAQATLAQRLSEQKAMLVDKDAQLAAAAATRLAFEQAALTTNASIASLAATQTAQQSDYNVMETAQADLLAARQQDQAALAQLKANQTCANSTGFKADYTSNAAMSKALKTFVGEIGGSTAIGTWDLLLPASPTTLHRVTVFQDGHSFINTFLVYFDQADGPARGVFWVNRACWLDR